MKLYGSLASPYVRKLRVLIAEKQLQVEFVVLPSAADARVATLNPLGKLPVLQRDDGSTMFDSPVIAEYLDSFTAPALIPHGGEARWQVLAWQALADGILDATVARMLEGRRPPELQSTDARTHQEGKVARAIAFAQQQLGDGAWLVEDRFSLADIALTTALEYVDFRYPHAWRLAHPRLANWLLHAAARPSFAATQPPT